MKRKLFATLLCLLMMATLLPVGSTAADDVATNMIPNGDFETDFVKISGVTRPAEGWSATLSSSTKGEFGKISRVETDTYGEGEDAVVVNPAVKESTHFLKYEKLQTEESTPTRITYPISAATGFVEGKTYRAEAYVYIPENNGADGAEGFLFCDSATSDRGSPRLSVGAGDFATVTNGWVKLQYNFVYTAKDETGKGYDLSIRMTGTAAKVVYFDEIKVYEINSNSLLSCSGFFNLAQDISDLSTGSSSVAENEYALRTEPGNTSNFVILVPAIGLVDQQKNTAYPVKVPVSASKCSSYDLDDFVKISFRVKIVSSTVPEADVMLPIRANNTLFGVSQNYIGAGITIPSDKVNSWVNVEYITHANKATAAYSFGSIEGYDYYLDDIDIVPVTESFINDMTLWNEYDGSRKGADGTTTYWLKLYWGVKGDSLTKDDTIIPKIWFKPDTATDKALAAVAVYKTDDVKRTLVDIKLNYLEASDTLEPICYDEQIDLSTSGLEPGNYEVEYFLWKNSGLLTLSDSVSIPITITSSTPEA